MTASLVLLILMGLACLIADCMFSLAVFPRGVALSFYYGATLPDPRKILSGSGNEHRFVRLENAAVLSRPEVEALPPSDLQVDDDDGMDDGMIVSPHDSSNRRAD